LSNQTAKPVVGIPASVRSLEFNMAFHGTAQQYLHAVRQYVGATVFTIPSLRDESNAMELLDMVDGILLTGSFSGVHPSVYGEPVRNGASNFDPQRDAVTLPLIRMALDRGVPLFGICRGLQEINVALGGSLHQALHELQGRDDHRSDATLPLEEQFGPAHDIQIVPGGLFSSLVGERRFSVNTSHMEGVDNLASGLRIEATSDDGTIEALSAASSPQFFVGVQFHPEWGTAYNELYTALFQAFRRAVCQRAAVRIGEARSGAS